MCNDYRLEVEIASIMEDFGAELDEKASPATPQPHRVSKATHIKRASCSYDDDDQNTLLRSRAACRGG